MLEGLTQHSKDKELTLRDGTKVFYREWHGRKDRAVVVHVHGLESHTGWFVDTADLLCSKGFHVYAVDRRGSGMNSSNRGHMESFNTVVDDIREVVELARRENPDRKLYLTGSCWGGKTTVAFTARYNDLIDGLILITPAIKSKCDLPLIEKLDVIYNNFFQPRKLIKLPLDDTTFTRDADYAKFIHEDQLKLKFATARFFFETGKANFGFDGCARKIKVPVLVLLSGDDTIVDNDRMEKWFEKITSADKIIKIYQGQLHGLLFEDPRRVTDDIANWILTKAHIKH